MADRKVTVAVEVQQTNKTTGSPAPGPAGEPGNRNVLPGGVGDLGRRLLNSISSGIGGSGIGGGTAAAFAGISQALKTGVVSGFQASKGILAGAVMVGVKTAGGLVTGVAGGIGRASNFLQPSDAAIANVGPQLAGGFRNMALGLGLATAAASAFTASMSPMTFSTLTGSVQLLGNEFVKLLIPAFSMASLTIQNVTKWMAGLDEGTKNLIASTATWAAPGLVALGIFGALAPILKLVAGGVLLLGGALATTGRALLAFALTPAGAAFTALAVTVGILTNGFGLLGDSIERSGLRANEARERIARLQEPGAQVTRRDFEALDVGTRRLITEAPAGLRRAGVEGLIARRENDMNREFGREPERRAAIIEQTLQGMTTSNFTGEQRRTAIVDALARAGFERLPNAFQATELQGSRDPRRLGTFNAEEVQNFARERSGVNAITGLRDEIAILARIRDQGVPGLFQGLRQSTPMQAQMFQSGSDAYYQVLQEVASRGQLEQDILREIMQNTAAQVAIMQAQNGGVANPPPLPPGAFPPN